MLTELSEVKWRSLSIAVMQRLKRLLTGVSDPEAVKHENAAREERKALAAKHKAEAKHQRILERRRSVSLVKTATQLCLLLQSTFSSAYSSQLACRRHVKTSQGMMT